MPRWRHRRSQYPSLVTSKSPRVTSRPLRHPSRRPTVVACAHWFSVLMVLAGCPRRRHPRPSGPGSTSPCASTTLRRLRTTTSGAPSRSPPPCWRRRTSRSTSRTAPRRTPSRPATGHSAVDELALRLVRGHVPPQRPAAPLPLGEALLDTRRRKASLATIYVERVERLARDSHADPAVLLGRAIAHELVHALTGRGTHAPQRADARRMVGVGGGARSAAGLELEGRREGPPAEPPPRQISRRRCGRESFRVQSSEFLRAWSLEPGAWSLLR